MKDGTVGDISAGDRSEIEAIKDRWSASGKRVILLAQKAVDDDWVKSLVNLQDERLALHAAENNLTFVGIVGLVDPPVRKPASTRLCPG